MKYTISVSKTYKHRGGFRHKLSTKKHWFHYFYENDEIDEELKLFCEQVGWLKAMYYKGRKYKRRHVTCPNCKKEGVLNLRSSLTRTEIESRCKCIHCATMGQLKFLRA